MKKSMHKTMVVTLAAVLVSTFVIMPATANARWGEYKDNLPGLVNMTPYFIAAGVLVGGIIIYKIASHKSKTAPTDSTSVGTSKEGKSTPANDTATQDSTKTSGTPADDHLILTPTNENKLGLFINVTDDRSIYDNRKSTIDLSDMTLRAGFTLRF